MFGQRIADKKSGRHTANLIRTLLDRFRLKQDKGETPCYLSESSHWHIDSADFYRAFQAFSDVVPTGSVLGIAEGAWPPAVRAFLDEYGVTIEASVLSSLPVDFQSARFLPVNAPIMRQAEALAERQAEHEFATHLIVVNNGVSLIEWYDLPQDPITIRFSIEESLVARFATATGGRYCPIKLQSNNA